MMYKRLNKNILLFLFLFLLHMIVVMAQPVISTVHESPSQVLYEESVEITATISSSAAISTVTLRVDGIDYQMLPSSPNQYAVSLHTIHNLAALGFAVYPYTITAIDVLGNSVSTDGSIEVIMTTLGDDPTLSTSEIQNILDWVLLWTFTT